MKNAMRSREGEQLSTNMSKEKVTQYQTSVLPFSMENLVIRSADELIEQYLLKNLTNSYTLTLNPNVISIQYSNNSKYVGQFVSLGQIHFKQGRGVYKYSNQDVYIGDWRNDTFHGVGIYVFANRDLFQGLFQNGYTTKGLMIYNDGSLYEGEFKDGLREGYGIMKSGKKNQNSEQDPQWQEVYEGSWKQNLKNGHGILKYKSFQLKGTWENGQISGKVSLFSKNPRQAGLCYYQGLMMKGELINGKCKIQFSEDFCYQGEICQGKFDGKGRLSQLQNQNQNYRYTYEGDFKKGVVQGHGRFSLSQKNSQLLQKCILQYEGNVYDNKAEGFGRIIYINGESYEGNFLKGLKQGYGKYIFKNGDVYEGQFRRDLMEGDGQYYWANLNLRHKGRFQSSTISSKATIQMLSGLNQIPEPFQRGGLQLR